MTNDRNDNYLRLRNRLKNNKPTNLEQNIHFVTQLCAQQKYSRRIPCSVEALRHFNSFQEPPVQEICVDFSPSLPFPNFVCQYHDPNFQPNNIDDSNCNPFTYQDSNQQGNDAFMSLDNCTCPLLPLPSYHQSWTAFDELSKQAVTVKSSRGGSTASGRGRRKRADDGGRPKKRARVGDDRQKMKDAQRQIDQIEEQEKMDFLDDEDEETEEDVDEDDNSDDNEETEEDEDEEAANQGKKRGRPKKIDESDSKDEKKPRKRKRLPLTEENSKNDSSSLKDRASLFRYLQQNIVDWAAVTENTKPLKKKMLGAFYGEKPEQPALTSTAPVDVKSEQPLIISPEAPTIVPSTTAPAVPTPVKETAVVAPKTETPVEEKKEEVKPKKKLVPNKKKLNPNAPPASPLMEIKIPKKKQQVAAKIATEQPSPGTATPKVSEQPSPMPSPSTALLSPPSANNNNQFKQPALRSPLLPTPTTMQNVTSTSPTTTNHPPPPPSFGNTTSTTTTTTMNVHSNPPSPRLMQLPKPGVTFIAMPKPPEVPLKQYANQVLDDWCSMHNLERPTYSSFFTKTGYTSTCSVPFLNNMRFHGTERCHDEKLANHYAALRVLEAIAEWWSSGKQVPQKSLDLIPPPPPVVPPKPQQPTSATFQDPARLRDNYELPHVGNMFNINNNDANYNNLRITGGWKPPVPSPQTPNQQQQQQQQQQRFPVHHNQQQLPDPQRRWRSSY